jgi:hypothetical protein
MVVDKMFGELSALVSAKKRKRIESGLCINCGKPKPKRNEDLPCACLPPKKIRPSLPVGVSRRSARMNFIWLPMAIDNLLRKNLRGEL